MPELKFCPKFVALFLAFTLLSFLLLTCQINCASLESSAAAGEISLENSLAGKSSHQENFIENFHRRVVEANNNRPENDKQAAAAHLLEVVPEQSIENEGPVLKTTTFPEKNCSSCMTEDARLARIERIKSELLQKLGLKEPPNVVAPDLPHLMPHINGLLDRWGFDKEHFANAGARGYQADQPFFDPSGAYNFEHTMAKTERVFAFATEPPVFLGLPESMPIAYFKFSPDTQENHVDNATLRFFVRKPENLDENEPTVELVARLYEIHHANGTKRPILHKYFKKDLRQEGHWDEFGISKIVRHWFKKPEKNFGLVVEVMFNQQNLAVMPRSTDFDKNAMYVELSVSESERSRRKRDASLPTCGPQEKSCCLQPLQIDFESFGWHWIAVPKRYNAHFCGGECRFRQHQSYSHTHLVQQTHAAQKASASSSSLGAQASSQNKHQQHQSIGAPCCHSTVFGPLQMIHYNANNELVVSLVPNMVALRCGCA